jgi:hypothetical protein
MIHNRHMALAMAAVLAAAGMARGQQTPANAADLSWPRPTLENKLWTRWWWLGNAVDEKNITRQLEQFSAAGMGGVEICPIYGTYGVENKYIDFLSPKWMGMLAHTHRETKRLGMAVDMTTGTGWPFGGNMVPDANASQGIVFKTLDHYQSASELTAGKLVGVIAYPPSGQAQDVTAKNEGGTLPPGTRYLAAVQTGPQQKVKRPAPGAEGNVVDPYSVESLNQYLAVFDKAFESFRDVTPRTQFHDSFEYYSATWTPKFFDEFQKRRGYDIRPHLAALNNEGNKETISRVKCDYRETLSDLHLEYMNRWVEWSHTRGGLGRNQAHGGPGNILDVYANADIPECEIFHLYDETQVPFLKLASSGAHVTGKKLTSAESFTWLDEHFNSSLAQVKPAADFLFLTGVNHLFLHGVPYSPEEAAWPGWQFYASVNFGPTGGIWRDFPAFTAYVARCQSILQANRPSNDVLLYLPWHEFWSDPANNDKLMIQFTIHNTWMASFPYFTTAKELWEKGYGYDEISDRLLQNAKVNDKGEVDMAGNTYRALVIPQTPMMPVETMRKLTDLARAGATVTFIGGMPTDVPGMHDLENRRAQLKQLTGSLTLSSMGAPNLNLRGTTLGKGKIVVSANASNSLATHAAAEPMMGTGLRFIRRERADGFDYFVVNRTDKTVENVILGREAQSALIMDPLAGDRIGVGKILRGKTPNAVELTVHPGQAYFIRTFTSREIAGKPWDNFKPAGSPRALAGTWNVSFIDGGPVLPKAFATGRLDSWTVLGDADAKRFAGTARYTLTFDRPRNAADYQLNLGKVGDSARVTLNGASLGTLWSEPYSINVGPALKAGSNTLEIEVTNVAANRIRDMDQRGVQWKIFRDANVLSTAYTAFDASSWPIRSAGLMGPVTLTPLSK